MATSLRIDIDLAVPLPAGFTGTTVAEGFAALSPAVRTRLIALRDAIKAARADAVNLNAMEAVRARAHICKHGDGVSKECVGLMEIV